MDSNPVEDALTLQKLCIKQVDHYLLLAERKLKIVIPKPAIRFSITGRTAGRAWYHKNLIEFNPKILRLNAQDFLVETTGHEVAHLIAHARHKGQIKAHGSEWTSVMWTFGLPAKRCHNYDTEDTGRKNKGPVVYKRDDKIVRPISVGRVIEFD